MEEKYKQLQTNPIKQTTKVELPKSFTTVTKLSKILALILFIMLPYMGFILGVKYEKLLYDSNPKALVPCPDLSSSETKTQEGSEVINIENWKVYENKYYKYQLSIPNDWSVEEFEHNTAPVVILTSADKNIQITSRIDLLTVKNPGMRGDSIDMEKAIIGKFITSRTYYSPYTTETGKKGYLLYFDTNSTDHPENTYLPFFGAIVWNDLEKNTQTIYEVLKSFKNTGVLAILKDQINYSIPSGWSESESHGSLIIQSPDYKPGNMGVLQGINILISSQIILPSRNLETEKKEWKQSAGISNISDTTIDSLPAIKFHIDYEGHQLDYVVIKDGYSFRINISSPSLAEEEKNRTTIDEFINSIDLR